MDDGDSVKSTTACSPGGSGGGGAGGGDGGMPGGGPGGGGDGGGGDGGGDGGGGSIMRAGHGLYDAGLQWKSTGRKPSASLAPQLT